MPRFSLLLAAGLLSLGAGAMAQPPEPPLRGPGAPGGRPPMQAPAPMKRADLKAKLEATFDRLDANHDGKLTPDDRVAMRAQVRDKLFDKLDTNKDGKISKEEFAAAAANFGNRQAAAGGPGDGPGKPGMMNRRGMMRHAAMMRRMGHEGPEARHDGRMGGRDGLMLGGPEGPMRAWMRDPVNQPVTRAAFLEHGLALFDKADTDHDGIISPAERDAARGPMRDRRPMRGTMPPPPPPGQ